MYKESVSVVLCVNRRMSDTNPSCANSGSEELGKIIERKLRDNDMDVAVEKVYCLGDCHNGPNLRIDPGGQFFNNFKEENIPELLHEIEILSKR